MWIAVLTSGALLAAYGFLAGTRHQSDFAGYYTAARVVITGDSVSRIYDREWFTAKMHSYGIADSTLIMYVNPPSVALVMTPLAWLNPVAAKTAKTAWNVINLLLVVLIWVLLRHTISDSAHGLAGPLLAAMLVCTLPFLRNLERGQIYILVLLLLTIFWRGYSSGKEVRSSLALAAMLLLKYFGWMFLLLFVIERRWKELFLTLLFFVVGSIATLILVGDATYTAHLRALAAAFEGNDFAVTGLPCIPAFFGSLFSFDSRWNVHPAFNVTWLAGALTLLSLAAGLMLTFLRTPRGSQLRVAAVVFLSVIFTPLAADHHYMLLALPCWYILVEGVMAGNMQRTPRIVAIVLIAALLVWYPVPPAIDYSGLWKLFAFPRLYAACGLWGLIVSGAALTKVVKNADIPQGRTSSAKVP